MSESDGKGGMTVREAGRLGGCKVRDEGLVDYEEMGRKGGVSTKERHGSEHYQEIGGKGGRTTAERYGVEHYERIGKQGGARMRDLVEKGRASEGEE